MAYYSRVISYQNDGNIENGPFVHILLFPMGHFFSGESGPLQLDTMVDITIYRLSTGSRLKRKITRQH